MCDDDAYEGYRRAFELHERETAADMLGIVIALIVTIIGVLIWVVW